MPTSCNTVIFKFRLIFATDEQRIVSGKVFHTALWRSPLIRGNKRNTYQWASTKHHYGRFFPTQFLAHQSQISRVFENDCISRNEYRIKITQPNLMILVSFSSAEDALSNGVN